MQFLPTKKCLKDLYESMLGLQPWKTCMSKVFGRREWGADWDAFEWAWAEEARSIDIKEDEWFFEDFKGAIKTYC